MTRCCQAASLYLIQKRSKSVTSQDPNELSYWFVSGIWTSQDVILSVSSILNTIIKGSLWRFIYTWNNQLARQVVILWQPCDLHIYTYIYTYIYIYIYVYLCVCALLIIQPWTRLIFCKRNISLLEGRYIWFQTLSSQTYALFRTIGTREQLCSITQ